MVEPFPSAVVTSIRPPLRRANALAEASPNPVPCPSSLVVKNGSKMRGRTASAMPLPVSRTEIQASPRTTCVLTVTLPGPFDRVHSVRYQVEERLFQFSHVHVDDRRVRAHLHG